MYRSPRSFVNCKSAYLPNLGVTPTPRVPSSKPSTVLEGLPPPLRHTRARRDTKRAEPRRISPAQEFARDLNLGERSH
jgi:hypothetical protein